MKLAAVSFRIPAEPNSPQGDRWHAYTIVLLPRPDARTLGYGYVVPFLTEPKTIQAEGSTREEALKGLAALVGDALTHLSDAEVTDIEVEPRALPRPRLTRSSSR